MLATPLVSYPTTVLWLDADTLFLQIITEEFKRNFNIKTFCSPVEAMHFFQKHQSASTSMSFLHGYTDHEQYDLSDHLPVDINLEAFHKLRGNPQRLQDSAVIVLDYSMSGITGIDLCYKLRGLPIKKILLASEADYQQVIQAFNDGIIDCFIRKDNLNVPTDLLMYIKKLTVQYFNEITKPLLAHLEADYKLPQSDPTYSDFFNRWCHENNIREHYLIDKNGTLLTINESGIVQYFLTHTDRSLNLFTELYAEDVEVNAFIQSVIKRNKIPFFGLKKEAWNFEFNDWNNYFYSPEILDGRERYYWAVIKDESFINSNKLKIV